MLVENFSPFWGWTYRPGRNRWSSYSYPDVWPARSSNSNRGNDRIIPIVIETSDEQDRQESGISNQAFVEEDDSDLEITLSYDDNNNGSRGLRKRTRSRVPHVTESSSTECSCPKQTYQLLPGKKDEKKKTICDNVVEIDDDSSVYADDTFWLLDSDAENSRSSVYSVDSDCSRYFLASSLFGSDSNASSSPSVSQSSKPRDRDAKQEKEINETPSYSVYNYLHPLLRSIGRQIDYIKGDGNCFFRALSKVLYDSQSFHDEVRQAVVDVIEKYPKKFEQFLDEGNIKDHILSMRNIGTWATQTEIYAAATILQRDLYILSPDPSKKDTYRWLLFSPLFKYSGDISYHPCPITLCHTHGNHYDRVAPLVGKCNCGLSPPELSGVQDKVDLTDEVV